MFIQRKSAAVLDAPRTREAKRIVRPFAVKEVDEEAGTFQGLAAAFTLDQGGDVILPGAFKRTLSHWKGGKARTVPLIDTHNYQSATAIVGKMIEAKEVDEGLEARFQFIENDPSADAVRKRVQGGYVDGLSIGYEAVESRQPSDEDRRKGIWRYLKEVKLLEVSVVAFPMNVDARIDLASVKGMLDDFRARGLSADVLEEAKALYDELGALLSATAPSGEPLAQDEDGLAPDDPKRLALEATYRDVLLRGLRLQS